MDSSRNSLCEYDLDVELFKRFALNVYEVVPVRKAFILCTDKGNKILKKINYTIDELEFIYNSLNYVNKSFEKTITFVKTNEDKIYTIWDDDIYFVMDLVKGRESEYSNPIDLNIASKSLAQFHAAGEGISSYVNFQGRNNCGKLIESLQRRKEEMAFLKNIANWFDNKNEFDLDFLNNVDYIIGKMNESIAVLEESKYYKLCSEEDKVVLCHHDLAHHNIIISGREGYLIDFDYAIIDLKVHDLCNFITKAVKNFGYDIEKSRCILNEYFKFNKVDERELKVLYGMLMFPEDFYSISKDYYTKRKDWTLNTFIYKIEKKIDFFEEREEFLNEFKKMI